MILFRTRKIDITIVSLIYLIGAAALLIYLLVQWASSSEQRAASSAAAELRAALLSNSPERIEEAAKAYCRVLPRASNVRLLQATAAYRRGEVEAARNVLEKLDAPVHVPAVRARAAAMLAVLDLQAAEDKDAALPEICDRLRKATDFAKDGTVLGNLGVALYRARGAAHRVALREARRTGAPPESFRSLQSKLEADLAPDSPATTEAVKTLQQALEAGTPPCREVLTQVYRASGYLAAEQQDWQAATRHLTAAHALQGVHNPANPALRDVSAAMLRAVLSGTVDQKAGRQIVSGRSSKRILRTASGPDDYNLLVLLGLASEQVHRSPADAYQKASDLAPQRRDLSMHRTAVRWPTVMQKRLDYLKQIEQTALAPPHKEPPEIRSTAALKDLKKQEQTWLQLAEQSAPALVGRPQLRDLYICMAELLLMKAITNPEHAATLEARATGHLEAALQLEGKPDAALLRRIGSLQHRLSYPHRSPQALVGIRRGLAIESLQASLQADASQDDLKERLQVLAEQRLALVDFRLVAPNEDAGAAPLAMLRIEGVDSNEIPSLAIKARLGDEALRPQMVGNEMFLELPGHWDAPELVVQVTRPGHEPVTAEFPVQRDTSPPEIVKANPAEGQLVRGEHPVLRFTLQDDSGIDLESVRVILENRSVDPFWAERLVEGGRYRFDGTDPMTYKRGNAVSLPEVVVTPNRELKAGRYTIRVEASDIYGNRLRPTSWQFMVR